MRNILLKILKINPFGISLKSKLLSFQNINQNLRLAYGDRVTTVEFLFHISLLFILQCNFIYIVFFQIQKSNRHDICIKKNLAI
jgi:hypothetical protein